MTHETAEQLDLQHLYTNELQPLLADVEAERRAVRNRALFSMLIIAPLALALMLLGMRFLGGFGLVVAAIGGSVAWYLFNRGRMRAYRHNFKQHVLGRLIELRNPGLYYSPNGMISEHEFRASQIYRRRIDRYRGEDLISGTIGATAFRFSEVHAEYKTTTTDSKGRRKTTWHTIFKGIFFVADFNKHFNGVTLVYPDLHEGLLGGFGQTLQAWGGSLSGHGEIVKLEDPEFEELFVAYSDDQVEARYILSTSLMQRLVEFRRRMNVDIALSFVNSQIYLAIRTRKNHFEPPGIFFGAPLDFADVEEYAVDIELAQGIIEELNLNTRIWTKQ